MLRPFLSLIICCILVTASKAQTIRAATTNASINLIIRNSLRQIFVLGFRNQEGKYVIIDSTMLGEKGTADTIQGKIYIDGQEAHLGFGFRQKKLGYFAPTLAPGDHLKMTVDFNKPTAIVFSGSTLTQELYDFFAQREIVEADYFKYEKALKAGDPDSVVLKQKIDSIRNLQHLFFKKAVFNTNSGYVAIIALMNSQNGIVNYTPEEFNQLSEKFKDDKLVLRQININEKHQDDKIAIKSKPANGTYLTGFILPDTNGQQISLDNFKGKYVLVDFWASWCAPCRHESPYLKQSLLQFGKQNFVIVSVSIDEKPDSWKKAIEKDGTQAFVHVIDKRGWKGLVTQQYNIYAIPSNFLIDPSGKVIDKDLRGNKLVEKLTQVIPNTRN